MYESRKQLLENTDTWACLPVVKYYVNMNDNRMEQARHTTQHTFAIPGQMNIETHIWIIQAAGSFCFLNVIFRGIDLKEYVEENVRALKTPPPKDHAPWLWYQRRRLARIQTIIVRLY